MLKQMDPRVKQLWTSALRSGKITQIYGRLGQGDACCALGVLCEVYRAETSVKAHGPSGAGLPDVVVRWAGLTDQNCWHNPNIAFSESGDPINVVDANDYRKWNFNIIADHIDNNL